MALQIGYKASAEQFGPRELVEFGVEAERRGLGVATMGSPSSVARCSCSMKLATSSRVNLPAAWRCEKPMGPRASRKSW